jgi:hypothetical protein
MRTAKLCPTCAKYTNAKCVLYEGLYLPCFDIAPGEDMETILIKIQTFLLESGLCTTTTSTTTLEPN